MKDKNKKLREEFNAYCLEHPEMRWWQALRNWSGFDFVRVTRGNWNDEV